MALERDSHPSPVRRPGAVPERGGQAGSPRAQDPSAGAPRRTRGRGHRERGRVRARGEVRRFARRVRPRSPRRMPRSCRRHRTPPTRSAAGRSASNGARRGSGRLTGRHLPGRPARVCRAHRGTEARPLLVGAARTPTGTLAWYVWPTRKGVPDTSPVVRSLLSSSVLGVGRRGPRQRSRPPGERVLAAGRSGRIRRAEPFADRRG